MLVVAQPAAHEVGGGPDHLREVAVMIIKPDHNMQDGQRDCS